MWKCATSTSLFLLYDISSQQVVFGKSVVRSEYVAALGAFRSPTCFRTDCDEGRVKGRWGHVFKKTDRRSCKHRQALCPWTAPGFLSNIKHSYSCKCFNDYF